MLSIRIRIQEIGARDAWFLCSRLYKSERGREREREGERAMRRVEKSRSLYNFTTNSVSSPVI